MAANQIGYLNRAGTDPRAKTDVYDAFLGNGGSVAEEPLPQGGARVKAETSDSKFSQRAIAIDLLNSASNACRARSPICRHNAGCIAISVIFWARPAPSPAAIAHPQLWRAINRAISPIVSPIKIVGRPAARWRFQKWYLRVIDALIGGRT